ncbi:hypothetical protein BDQ12DRAFT_603704 [Crucibulum laeve]|uniref:Uncharacterized protein n=1 Tax=Crucibulum laeve TaxID=68775 RepID=A0A5C3MEG3_9AGAR|nr:hypothetical protein BDQ12DRAFT_603704 [Crucibulum laeve]
MHGAPSQDKVASSHLYLRQPHTVQIIQLVEGPPPPPRRMGSVIEDSSASSSSSCDYSSEYSESAVSDEEESVCSSYCSSASPEEELEFPSKLDSSALSTEAASDTFNVRMKRILVWRENFDADLSATLSDSAFSSSPSLKRKINSDEDDEDNVSHSSKRSRSQSPASDSSLGALSCPACDASFFTHQSLRQHGRDGKANEACCVAVEYAFE